MTDMLDLKQDWIEADLKLIVTTQTKQEKCLERFMRENQHLLDEKPWVAAGHSLGGALSEHAAVVAAKHGYGYNTFDGATSFDGPGHSKEYIEENRKYIDCVADKMVCKRASIVGSLLWEFPGVRQEFVETNDVAPLDKHRVTSKNRAKMDLVEENRLKSAEHAQYDGLFLLFFLKMA